MLAVVAERPGPPAVLRLVERPDPRPGEGEVAVAVAVAAITFLDTQTRAGGGPRPIDASEFPVVLGNGVAGTVAEVGAGVDPSWLGARVVTATGGRGGYATRAVAAAGDLHRIPDGVDDATAAALLADGRTALGLVRAAAVAAGEVVVITAAAGGVGGLVVQLAAAAGAKVVGLAGGDRKVAHVRAGGLAEVVDYRAAGWTEHLDAVAPTVDVVFDGVGGDVTPVLVPRVGPGGRYVQHGMASGTQVDLDAAELERRGVTLVPLSAVAADPAELHRLVDDALAMAAAGTLRPTIGQTFPLAEAAAAHAAIEARRTIGKTLLVPVA